MASLKTQKKWARIRDRQQCQLCGDVLPIPYGRLEVHHILPRCQGGADDLDNLITLCDLCHAIAHDHMGPAWIGLSQFPKEEQEQIELNLKNTKEEFESFLRLSAGERYRIQKQLWPQWGVKRLP